MLLKLMKFAAQLSQIGMAEVRGDKSQALVTTDGHGRYQEAALQGNLFSLSTAAAGVTIAAANVFSSAAAQPLVGIANPPASGFNGVILLGTHTWNSGTPAAGGLVWATCPANNLVTAPGGNGAIGGGSQAAGGSVMRTFVNAAMTGITGAQIYAFAGGPSVGALAANSNQHFVSELAGILVVPPGSIGGLFAAAAGTSPIVNASMFWEEVAV